MEHAAAGTGQMAYIEAHKGGLRQHRHGQVQKEVVRGRLTMLPSSSSEEIGHSTTLSLTFPVGQADTFVGSAGLPRVGLSTTRRLAVGQLGEPRGWRAMHSWQSRGLLALLLSPYFSTWLPSQTHHGLLPAHHGLGSSSRLLGQPLLGDPPPFCQELELRGCPTYVIE